jgi:hypothetical protein
VLVVVLLWQIRMELHHANTQLFGGFIPKRTKRTGTPAIVWMARGAVAFAFIGLIYCVVAINL